MRLPSTHAGSSEKKQRNSHSSYLITDINISNTSLVLAYLPLNLCIKRGISEGSMVEIEEISYCTENYEVRSDILYKLQRNLQSS